MNNLYHKIAVASVCTALGFALGANKEAYSATFSNSSSPYTQLTFHALDGGSYGNFDGLGDAVTNVSYGNNPEGGYNHSWNMTGRTAVSEQASLIEYSLPFLGLFVNRLESMSALLRCTSPSEPDVRLSPHPAPSNHRVTG